MWQQWHYLYSVAWTSHSSAATKTSLKEQTLQVLSIVTHLTQWTHMPSLYLPYRCGQIVGNALLNHMRIFEDRTGPLVTVYCSHQQPSAHGEQNCLLLQQQRMAWHVGHEAQLPRADVDPLF